MRATASRSPPHGHTRPTTGSITPFADQLDNEHRYEHSSTILFVEHRAVADVKTDRDELLHEIAHCKSMLEISRGQVVASSQELRIARNALFAHEILVEAQPDREALVHEMAHV
jgi:hypothetical protein